MVGVDHIIQIFYLSVLRVHWQLALLLQRRDRASVGWGLVGVDL